VRITIYCPFSASDKKSGLKLLCLFLERHPDIGRKEAQNLDAERAVKLNGIFKTEYFEKLLKEKGIIGILGASAM
jgi:hypothetical protein